MPAAGGRRPAELRHVSIEVRDLARSSVFYDRFLGRLGFRRFVREADYAGYQGGRLAVWVLQGRPERVRRRPPTGEEEVVAEHLAFWVPSSDEVEAVQRDLERAELYPVFRAAERPEFRPGYVSAAWADPDQTVLEVYTVPARPASHRTRRARKPPRAPARGSKRRPG
jgi:catechol 2,3-dioxygenase-like lactoylglutathione lyase family enzyme